MRTRLWLGLALTCVTIVILVLGMLNPGAAIAAVPVSGALIVVTWVVSRVPVPVPLIVAWAVTTVALGLTVVGAAFVALSSPTGIEDEFPWWLWGVAVCFAATAACAVWYLVRHVNAVRQIAPISD